MPKTSESSENTENFKKLCDDVKQKLMSLNAALDVSGDELYAESNYYFNSLIVDYINFLNNVPPTPPIVLEEMTKILQSINLNPGKAVDIEFLTETVDRIYPQARDSLINPELRKQRNEAIAATVGSVIMGIIGLALLAATIAAVIATAGAATPLLPLTIAGIGGFFSCSMSIIGVKNTVDGVANINTTNKQIESKEKCLKEKIDRFKSDVSDLKTRGESPSTPQSSSPRTFQR